MVMASLSCAAAFAQRSDDPVASRLFVMPTGQINRAGQALIGTMGPLGPRVSYAASTFVQLDAGGFYSPFPQFFSYATGGVKVQALRPVGLFGGLAVGADFGLMYGRGGRAYRGSLMAYNVATSFGNDDAMLHLNATSLPYGTTDTTTLDVKYLVQAGLTVPIIRGPEMGLGAMVEYTAGGHGLRDAHNVLAALGARGHIRQFIWEAGLMLGPRCFGDCADVGIELYKIPYFSLMYGW